MHTHDPDVPLARRRRTLGMLAAGAALPLASLAPGRAGAQPQRLAPTPQDAEGPFYPRSIPSDADFDLMRVAGRDRLAQGAPLHLSGRVVGVDGIPLEGAVLELWQCDIHGRYHHVGGPAGEDEDFQGYGRAVAGAEGRYGFVAMRPVAYASRPPHLHFRVSHPGHRRLTTQLYLEGEAAERGFAGMFSRERERLLIAPKPVAGREPGALAAGYTFVLAVL